MDFGNEVKVGTSSSWPMKGQISRFLLEKDSELTISTFFSKCPGVPGFRLADKDFQCSQWLSSTIFLQQYLVG